MKAQLLVVFLMSIVSWLQAQDTECDYTPVQMTTDTVVINTRVFRNWEKFEIVFKSVSDSVRLDWGYYEVSVQKEGESIRRKLTRERNYHVNTHSPYFGSIGGTQTEIGQNKFTVSIFRKYNYWGTGGSGKSKYNLTDGIYSFEVKVWCSSRSYRYKGVLLVD